MRSHDLDVAVADALTAAEWVVVWCSSIAFDRFAQDEALRSAVERKLEILGGALSRASRTDAAIVRSVPDLPRIIGLRNVLAHGYDVIDPQAIYLIATTKVPELVEALRQLSSMSGAE